MHKQLAPEESEDKFARIFSASISLIEEGNTTDAAKLLSGLHCADLADFIDRSGIKVHKKILPLLFDVIDPKTLIWLSDYGTRSLTSILGERKISALISNLDIEDAIEVLERLRISSKNLILDNLDGEKRKEIIEGFTYPENSAGRIVEKDFVFFYENWTVGQAIDSMRKKNKDKEFYAAIIVDEKFRPVGTLPLSLLLVKKRTDKIKNFAGASESRSADPFTRLSEIAFIFKQYALTILPIVNKNGKLLGTLSLNNMVYVIEGQMEKNLMRLGGAYGKNIYNNFFAIVRHRLPWLLTNLCTAWITSTIIDQFTDLIAHIVVLAAIMPIVASTGGNAGTQVMAVTILALSNKDINKSNMAGVIAKETFLCLFSGLALASIGGSVAFLLLGDLGISLIFASAVVANFCVAGFFGSSLPIILYNKGLDPATSSGILLTALTDAFGFFSFLFLSYSFLL